MSYRSAGGGNHQRIVSNFVPNNTQDAHSCFSEEYLCSPQRQADAEAVWVVHCGETIPVKFLTLSTTKLVLLPSWFWAKTISGLLVSDTAKSGFERITSGRMVSLAVMEAVKMTATSSTQRGTGLAYLDEINRVPGDSSKLSNEPCANQDPLSRSERKY